MKKTAVIATVMLSLLSGCVAYAPPHSGHRDYAYRDRDRDGVSNRHDRDRDGDGVPNRRDRHPNDARWY